MSATEATVVHARGSSEADALITVTASTAEDLIDAVQQAPDISMLLVAVDDAASGQHDVLVALVSVLVSLGVEHIETTEPRSVKRVFDTHHAIAEGAIEVLET